MFECGGEVGIVCCGGSFAFAYSTYHSASIWVRGCCVFHTEWVRAGGRGGKVGIGFWNGVCACATYHSASIWVGGCYVFWVHCMGGVGSRGADAGDSGLLRLVLSRKG